MAEKYQYIYKQKYRNANLGINDSQYCGKQRGQKRLCHGTAHYAKRDLWWCSTTQGFNFAFATLSHNGHKIIFGGVFLIS